YEQMPCPKFVVAVGACAINGGVFAKSYSVVGGVDKVIPVDVYIPGCPPRPEAILDGIVKLLKMIEEGKVVSKCEHKG
ncbi:MAG: NADH-quinone oxidoreductase subunit B, partial [Ignisphaera sp.]|nr:NADH-quinone oxidoreductase subunit B [Ignisphaera sp.]